VAYQRLKPHQYRACLATGAPFVIGFTVYESFESAAVATTGVVPMPGPGERALGGHAVCVIGYRTTRAGQLHYEVRNSWGPAWGVDGSCWMPAAYIEDLNLADDAWVIRA
ncbi:MAG: C1 family peptidase, partial [Hyphomonadaceae bacterium]|nr:C1 family peptidase [Hyphomonadaceae bacterium]